MQLKEILPPFLIRVLQTLFFFKVQCKGNYKNYEEAKEVCTGYENSTLVDIIYKKTIVFKNTVLKQQKLFLDAPGIQTLLGLCLSSQAPELNIIDFGGGFGYHYFLVKAVLKDKYRIKWHVIETPTIVKKANSLQTEELLFFSHIHEALYRTNEVNIVFSSGTLQYLPNPYQILENLASIKADSILLIRTPLFVKEEAQERYAVQYSRFSVNGPGELPNGMKDGKAKYPITFLLKKRVENIIEDNYNIRILFDSPDSLTYNFKSVKLYGFLACKKNNNR